MRCDKPPRISPAPPCPPVTTLAGTILVSPRGASPVGNPHDRACVIASLKSTGGKKT